MRDEIVTAPCWFEEGPTSKALPHPEELLRAHRSFRKRLRRDTKDKNRNFEPAWTKEALLEQIEESRDGLPRRPSAIQHFRRASAAHNAFQADRQQGVKKWSQEHAAMFGQFVEKYSRVIEAVASAGGPYGTVAYQTLSVLLAVCVNKVKNDTRVIDMIDALRKSLPRLESWDSIYPTDAMKNLVAAAYTQVTDFSRRAAEYLTRFWKRFFPALSPVLGYDFEKITGDIHKTFAEINAEAMFGLHQRSQRTEDQVVSSGKLIEDLRSKAEEAEKDRQKLLAQNKELLAQSEEATKIRQKLLVHNQELKQELLIQKFEAQRRDKQEDDRRLRAFEDLLQIQHPHPGTNLTSTKKVLMDVFPDLPPNARLVPHTGYTQMSKELLDQCPEFLSWNRSNESSLLFISGRTDWQGRRRKGLLHCWLSPIAIYITEDLLQFKNRVAFFSCLPDVMPEPVCASTVLSSIILQVLQWKPEMLREYDDDFRRILEKSNNLSRWSVRSLVELLKKVLAHISNPESDEDETVYIVIDRLDRCCGDEVSCVVNDLAGVVTALGDPSFRVKILIVAETSSGNAEWHKEWLLSCDHALHRLLSCQYWDQMKLTTIESSRKERPCIWSNGSAASVMTV